MSQSGQTCGAGSFSCEDSLQQSPSNTLCSSPSPLAHLHALSDVPGSFPDSFKLVNYWSGFGWGVWHTFPTTFLLGLCQWAHFKQPQAYCDKSCPQIQHSPFSQKKNPSRHSLLLCAHQLSRTVLLFEPQLNGESIIGHPQLWKYKYTIHVNIYSTLYVNIPVIKLRKTDNGGWTLTKLFSTNALYAYWPPSAAQQQLLLDCFSWFREHQFTVVTPISSQGVYWASWSHHFDWDEGGGTLIF